MFKGKGNAMYISVRRYTIHDEGTVDEIVRRVTEGFLPIISSSPGFKAYYAYSSGGNVISSVSVFDDEAGIEESNRRAAEWVKQNLAQFVAGPPEISSGEARAYKLA
jgi:hypothetical protein